MIVNKREVPQAAIDAAEARMRRDDASWTALDIERAVAEAWPGGKLLAGIIVALMVFLLFALVVADVAAQCMVWRSLVKRDGLTPEIIRQRPYGCSPVEEKAR